MELIILFSFLSLSLISPFEIGKTVDTLNTVENKYSFESSYDFTGEIEKIELKDGFYEYSPDSVYIFLRLTGSFFTSVAKKPLVSYNQVEYAYLDIDSLNNDILVFQFKDGTDLQGLINKKLESNFLLLVFNSRIVCLLKAIEFVDEEVLVLKLNEFGKEKKSYVLRIVENKIIDKTLLPTLKK